MMGDNEIHDEYQSNASFLTSCPTFRLASSTFFCGRRGVGILPAVAWASCPRWREHLARAGVGILPALAWASCPL